MSNYNYEKECKRIDGLKEDFMSIDDSKLRESFVADELHFTAGIPIADEWFTDEELDIIRESSSKTKMKMTSDIFEKLGI